MFILGQHVNLMENFCEDGPSAIVGIRMKKYIQYF